MPHEQWSAVDQYIADIHLPEDSALEFALSNSTSAGLPAINVSPNQGKFLYLLAKIHGAKRILEIGTLGGYSTIWLARALPADGRVVTLEFEPKHARVAAENIGHAGLADKVDIRVGPALETLPTLQGTFDFIFIDADKVSTAEYFTWALKLSHLGTVIIVDNVVRDGAIVETNSSDPGVVGVRRFNDLIRVEPRVNATAIQTVGNKGYDGFCIALVTKE